MAAGVRGGPPVACDLLHSGDEEWLEAPGGSPTAVWQGRAAPIPALPRPSGHDQVCTGDFSSSSTSSTAQSPPSPFRSLSFPFAFHFRFHYLLSRTVLTHIALRAYKTSYALKTDLCTVALMVLESLKVRVSA